MATGQADLERHLTEITDRIKAFIDDLNYNYCCAADTYEAGSRLLDTGRCEACPPFTRGDGGRVCSAASCPGGYVKQDGSCGTCGEYQRYDQARRTCITPTCTGGEVLQPGGSCAPCPLYRYPAPDGRSCDYQECSRSEYLRPDGRCAPCPAFTKPYGDGKQCTAATCPSGQVAQADGSCRPCPAF